MNGGVAFGVLLGAIGVVVLLWVSAVSFNAGRDYGRGECGPAHTSQ